MKLSYIPILCCVALLYSCGCDCHCEKSLGSETLFVKRISDSSTLIKKTYFSHVDFYSDTDLKDSVNAFIAKYSSDTTVITSKDSIGTPVIRSGLSCTETSPYEKQGYSCPCAK